MRDGKRVDWGVNGWRFVVLGEQGKWLGVWGPERIVEMACESGGRRWRGWRWAKVARLAGGVRGTMMSCQLGRETRGIHFHTI